VSRTLDLNTPSVLTTVCGISSRFVQVTIAPTGTVTVCGPKLKLSIFISAFAPEDWSLALSLVGAVNSSTTAIITDVAKPVIYAFRLVIVLYPFTFELLLNFFLVADPCVLPDH